jgi:hypothetical protein
MSLVGCLIFQLAISMDLCLSVLEPLSNATNTWAKFRTNLPILIYRDNRTFFLLQADSSHAFIQMIENSSRNTPVQKTWPPPAVSHTYIYGTHSARHTGYCEGRGFSSNFPTKANFSPTFNFRYAPP